MEKKIDLRVIKTYNKLTVSFGEMMQTTSFDDITVFDLCEKAEVRRATFYKHFNDKYDFFRSLVNIVIVNIDKKVCEITKNSSIIDYIINYVKELISYLNERPHIISNILKSDAAAVMLDIITNCTNESLKRHIESDKALANSLVVDTDTISRFVISGISTILLNSFKTDTASEEEHVAKIYAILNKLF